MSRSNRAVRQRGFARPRLFAAIAAAGLICLHLPLLDAQSPPVRGYITAVHPPDGFDINGEHVTTTAETRFGVMGTKDPAVGGPMRDAVEVGAWVEVVGSPGTDSKTMTAQSVFFRNDTKHKRSGLGIIVKVVATAPDLVIAADGYRILVTAATTIDYPDNMKSATDARAGQWVGYEGKLDQDGVLVADKVHFLPGKQMKQDHGQGPVDSSRSSESPAGNVDMEAKNISSPANDALCQTGDQTVGGEEIRLGRYNLAGYPTYRISKDRALQSRVRQIGVNLIPGYQNRLAPEDPSKIHFLFCAVDASAHEVITTEAAFEAGWILVPAQLARRFKNDDQLAALLADSIAYYLQQHPPFEAGLGQGALEVGTSAAAAFLAPITAGGASVVVGSIFRSEIELATQEQRSRVALQLMAAAGYDPWQAPEAWRLAAPRKMPADTSNLKYPNQAGYQLAILHLTYKKSATADATASGSAGNRNATGKP